MFLCLLGPVPAVIFVEATVLSLELLRISGIRTIEAVLEIVPFKSLFSVPPFDWFII